LKCINKLVLFGFLILGSSEVLSSEKVPTVQLRVLASHIAHKIVSAAVVDRNGNLVAFLRNPLSGPHTIKVSQRKAFSSATLRARTSEMSFRSDLNFAPDILLIVGGVPIQFVGNFYGGVAVAGAKPEIDEQCAQAGIDAISEIMEFAD